MPLNLLEYGQKMATTLDKAFVEKSKLGFLDTNPNTVEWASDEKTVLVSSIDMTGLGDYDRTNGFTRGSLQEIKRAYTLSMDRGTSFSLDTQDEREAGIKAATYFEEFQRKYVVPELDAYAIARIYNFAKEAGNTTNVTLATSNVISTISGTINDAMDVGDEGESYVCLVPRTTKKLIDTSTESTRNLDIGNFKQGEINTQVKMINEVPIIPITSKLMYSDFDFLNGVDDGQTMGGFKRNASAVAIQYIVMPMSAVKRITKTKKIRIFSPDVNQLADAWKFDYRRYYDVMSTYEQKKTILAAY